MDNFVTVILLEANGFIDQLISWRLESNWVHAAIEIDNVVYSSTFPKTVALSPTDKEVAIPPRTGASWNIPVTTEQKELILTYVKGRVGSDYDVLSMLGWALRIRSLQEKNETYCFEMVYDALSAAKLVPDRNKKFITGDQLEEFVLILKGTEVNNNAVGMHLLPRILLNKKKD